MDNTPSRMLDWKVLDWNVHGLNDKDKRLLVYNKIDESQCAIICLQETKCENFDHSFIRTFYPKRFDRFVFSPSVGASGGIIVLWNSSILRDNSWTYIDQQSEFVSPPNIIKRSGPLSLFMVLAEDRRGMILFNSYMIWTYLSMKTGCYWVISISLDRLITETEREQT